MTRLAKTVAILVVTLGLSACDDGADPAAEGRKRAPVQDTARFVGSWLAVSGTSSADCPGHASSSSPVDRRIKWSEGISSDLVLTQEGVPCVVNANVTAATASGSGPACNVSDSGIAGTYTISAYTFIIAADGQTAQEAFSATFIGTVAESNVTCPISVSATYQKVSK